MGPITREPGHGQDAQEAWLQPCPCLFGTETLLWWGVGAVPAMSRSLQLKWGEAAAVWQPPLAVPRPPYGPNMPLPARPVIPYRNCRPQTGGTGFRHPSSRRPSTQPAESTKIQVRLLPIGPTDHEISSQMSWGAREGGRGLWSYAGSSWMVAREPLLVNSTLPRLLH